MTRRSFALALLAAVALAACRAPAHRPKKDDSGGIAPSGAAPS